MSARYFYFNFVTNTFFTSLISSYLITLLYSFLNFVHKNTHNYTVAIFTVTALLIFRIAKVKDSSSETTLYTQYNAWQASLLTNSILSLALLFFASLTSNIYLVILTSTMFILNLLYVPVIEAVRIYLSKLEHGESSFFKFTLIISIIFLSLTLLNNVLNQFEAPFTSVVNTLITSIMNATIGIVAPYIFYMIYKDKKLFMFRATWTSVFLTFGSLLFLSILFLFNTKQGSNYLTFYFNGILPISIGILLGTVLTHLEQNRAVKIPTRILNPRSRFFDFTNRKTLSLYGFLVRKFNIQQKTLPTT